MGQKVQSEPFRRGEHVEIDLVNSSSSWSFQSSAVFEITGKRLGASTGLLGGCPRPLSQPLDGAVLCSLCPNRYNCGNAVFSDWWLEFVKAQATEVEIESRESGQKTMKRLLLIVALLLVAVSVGLLLQRVIPWSRQPQLVQPLQQQLDVIATVKPEFRISEGDLKTTLGTMVVPSTEPRH